MSPDHNQCLQFVLCTACSLLLSVGLLVTMAG
jgi:hypothetical protein